MTAEKHRRWKTGVAEMVCRTGTLTAEDIPAVVRRIAIGNCEAMLSVDLECRTLLK